MRGEQMKIEYDIAEEDNLVRFTAIVQQALNEGWKLEGNLVITNWRGEIWYYQAMTRVVEEVKDSTK
jgi:hypothetical protein